MKHFQLSGFDIPSTYVRLLEEIYYRGDNFKVGYGSETTWTKKLSVDVEIAIPQNRPLIAPPAPNDVNYVQGYVLEYLWENCRTPYEHYTYASRMREPVDQIELAMLRVMDNPMDRQVTLVIRRPEDINKLAPLIDGKIVLDDEGKPAKWEPPCLTMIDLDLEILPYEYVRVSPHVYFRSWDAFGAFPSNVAGLQLWNEALCREMNDRQEKWGYVTGQLILTSKNLHIYERQYPIVEEYFSKGCSELLRVKRKQ
jgi:thymidylate synthase